MRLLIMLLILSACSKKSTISDTIAQMSWEQIEYDYIRTEARKNKVRSELDK